MTRSLFLANGLPLRAITVPQFCLMYGLSRQTCYNLINSGQLQSVLQGGRRLVLVDSAEKLLGAPSSDAETIKTVLALYDRFMLS
jgi:predicted DNA-binding transcriptional regulator AlpA